MVGVSVNLGGLKTTKVLTLQGLIDVRCERKASKEDERDYYRMVQMTEENGSSQK
jgi:hypothetical protein